MFLTSTLEMVLFSSVSEKFKMWLFTVRNTHTHTHTHTHKHTLIHTHTHTHTHTHSRTHKHMHTHTHTHTDTHTHTHAQAHHTKLFLDDQQCHPFIQSHCLGLAARKGPPYDSICCCFGHRLKGQSSVGCPVPLPVEGSLQGCRGKWAGWRTADVQLPSLSAVSGLCQRRWSVLSCF